MNGGAKRKWWGITALLIVILCFSLSGCMPSYRIGGLPLGEIGKDERTNEEALYENVMVMLSEGTLENLNTLSASSSITFEEEWKAFQDFLAKYGTVQSSEVTSAYTYGDDTVVCGEAQLQNGAVCLDVKFDDHRKLVELAVYQPPDEAEEETMLPETLAEQEVTLGEGTDYPLSGVITMPKEAEDGKGKYPAVVLVHGNGVADRDMSAGSTHMFRDIAWGLAQQGIIVIRYDKRTYTYPEVWDETPSLDNLTVEWEYTEDALAATDILRQLPAVDTESVFYLGHSLGGLLAPRIDEAGGDYAGVILLSVPDGTWQEAAYQQYLNYGLANVDKDDVYYVCKMLESQKEEIDEGLTKYSDDELISQALLGTRAAYWKSLNQMNYAEAIVAMKKPLLLLQGSADYQIREDENFEGWKEKLKDHANAKLIAYEGGNHLLMRSQGCFRGNAKEYDMPNHVMEQVIQDIAGFITG